MNRSIYQFTSPEDYIENRNNFVYAVIHFDAEWDTHKTVLHQMISNIDFKNHKDTLFVYIDIDSNHELIESSGVLNVPCCAYYKNSKLYGTVIGANQEVESNLYKMKNGVAINGAYIPERKWWHFWLSSNKNNN